MLDHTGMLHHTCPASTLLQDEELGSAAAATGAIALLLIYWMSLRSAVCAYRPLTSLPTCCTCIHDLCRM
jgi:hypothetical protein